LPVEQEHGCETAGERPGRGAQHWLQIADEARWRTLIIARGRPFETELRILEQEAIKTSLADLLTSPGSSSG
jgi:hypothetical protein